MAPRSSRASPDSVKGKGSMNRFLALAMGALLVGAASAQDACDSKTLSQELAEAGLTPALAAGDAGVFEGCDSRGKIAWRPGHPTPAERALAAQVLAAHDPKADRCSCLLPLLRASDAELSGLASTRARLVASGATNLDAIDAAAKAEQAKFDLLANRWRLAKK